MSTPAVASGVYPIWKNRFTVRTAVGQAPAQDTYSDIADMESFSVSFDNGIEEWTPFETEGWVKRLNTSKSMTISLSGKRTIGDTGNDYIADMAFKSGTDLETKIKWVLANGDSLEFPCVINVTSAGGDSTGVEPLEFECLSNGKPTFTPAV